MSAKILVLNCGSSSIKYQLFSMPDSVVLAKGMIERIGEENSRFHHSDASGLRAESVSVSDHHQGMDIILNCFTTGKNPPLKEISEISAVGHRVVHGGEAFTGSQLITAAVKETLREYCDLAPLHNPPNLVGIEASEAVLPMATQVACFDTAFHATIPETAYLYALPYELYENYRVRRYGFHGTSHRYVARRAAQLLGKDKYALNAITCHLGNGCSMTAVKDGRSVDTSMGLTPLEGLVMGTRSGDIDPAIVFYLADKAEFRDLDSINTLLNKKSGLLGLSGESNDVRALLKAEEEGNSRAKLALDVFAYRVKKYIGAYAAALPRLDAVVFTGGIGENGASIRARILEGLDANLGIRIDDGRNEQAVGAGTGGVVEVDIAAADSAARVLVISTNEEKAIALDTYEITCSRTG